MKTQQQGDRSRGGQSRLGSQIDAPGMEQRIDQEGFRGRRGQGPEAGQGHFGSSARLSDRGSDGRQDRGENKGELGSHSGARRNRSSRSSE